MPWQSHAIFVEWFNRWHQANPGYGRSGPWRFERHRSQPALIQCPGRKESVAPGWYPGGTPLGQRSEGLNAFQLAVGPHWLLTLPWHAPSLASNRWWVWRKLKASQGARRSKQETHCDIFSGRWNYTFFLKASSDFRDHSTELEQLQGKIHRKPWISPPKRRNPDAWSHLPSLPGASQNLAAVRWLLVLGANRHVTATGDWFGSISTNFNSQKNPAISSNLMKSESSQSM